MANNCYNFIEITGDKSQLKELGKDLILWIGDWMQNRMI